MRVTLPPGEDRDLRDETMGLSMRAVNARWDDTMLREQWDEFGDVFGYNAMEAAEDWWIKWGSLGSGSADRYVRDEAMDFGIKVTRTAVSEMVASH
jgi:salicylate hydroxylase